MPACSFWLSRILRRARRLASILLGKVWTTQKLGKTAA
jgi:hypothetical protein